MNKKILRFYSLKDKRYFEVIFDERLSLLENFCILKDFYNCPTFEYIYDKENDIALDKSVPITVFNFSNFMTLYLI